jgi:RNA polymerase sigma-70 factor (ECF subfamily)
MAIEEMTDIESLYQRYAPDVRRFVLFLSGDPVTADEITSDTFVSAWLARERIRQPTVKSYLFAIARNLYRDLQRRRERHAELDEHMTDKQIIAQTHMEQTAEFRAVLAALQQLPEMDRTALLMRALDEMPYEEIAETLEIPVVTTKVKVYRARLKLMQSRQAWGKSFLPQEQNYEYYTGSGHGSVADLFFRRGQQRYEIAGRGILP